jgi:predicted dehydrogenase
MQSGAGTPLIQHINPDVDSGADFRSDWKEVAGAASYSNPYKRGWEEFLRHVVAGTPLRADLRAGIRDVQLVDACYHSIIEGKWIDMDASVSAAR